MDSSAEQFGNASVEQNNSRTSNTTTDSIQNGTVQNEDTSVWKRIKKVQDKIEKTTSKLTKLHKELKELIQIQENSTKTRNETPAAVHASPEHNAIIENGVESHPSSNETVEISVNNGVDRQEAIHESQDLINAEENNWLTEVRPLKSPYYPQIDDLIVYIPQGYHIYLEAVKKHQIYNVDGLQVPFIDSNRTCHQYAKVASIKYENYPPRVSCLQLQPINESNEPTGDLFEVRYHSINGVSDFLIPKQMYEAALAGTWRMGDRCYCSIRGVWFANFGCLESIEPYDSKFPNSLFKRYRVKFDDKREVKLSPWELEPTDNSNSQSATQYKSQPQDWSIDGKEIDKGNILDCLHKVLKLPTAKPFLHLSKDASYASCVKYPVDLSMILARLENNFYWRVNSLKFDIEQLAKNIEDIEKNPNSVIALSNGRNDNFKNYKIIHEILLTILENPESVNVYQLWEHLEENSQDEDDSSSNYVPSEFSQESELSVATDKTPLTPKMEWINACKILFDRIWNDEGSGPFRVFNPCETKAMLSLSLTNVKEYLDIFTPTPHYISPSAFSRHMNEVFGNRKYLGEQAKIHGERLKKLFNEEMDKIILSWKMNRKSKENKTSDKSPTKRSHNLSINLNGNVANSNNSPTKRSRRNNEGESSGMQTKSPRKFAEKNSEASKLKDNNQNGRRSPNLPDDNDEDEDDTNDGNDVSINNQVDSFNFSTSEYLRSLRPAGHHVESIIGIVTDFTLGEKTIAATGEQVQLLSFILDNNDGVKVNCDAWRLEADRIAKKIKRRRVIEIKYAKTDVPKYNDGNVHYKIKINNGTKVNVLKKNYRVHDATIEHR